jgi:hypothetical protein
MQGYIAEPALGLTSSQVANLTSSLQGIVFADVDRPDDWRQPAGHYPQPIPAEALSDASSIYCMEKMPRAKARFQNPLRQQLSCALRQWVSIRSGDPQQDAFLVIDVTKRTFKQIPMGLKEHVRWKLEQHEPPLGVSKTYFLWILQKIINEERRPLQSRKKHAAEAAAEAAAAAAASAETTTTMAAAAAGHYGATIPIIPAAEAVLSAVELLQPPSCDDDLRKKPAGAGAIQAADDGDAYARPAQQQPEALEQLQLRDVDIDLGGGGDGDFGDDGVDDGGGGEHGDADAQNHHSAGAVDEAKYGDQKPRAVSAAADVDDQKNQAVDFHVPSSKIRKRRRIPVVHEDEPRRGRSKRRGASPAGEQWEIERILDAAWEGRVRLYKVKWKNFPITEASWVKRQAFSPGGLDAVTAFERNLRAQHD